MKCSNTKLFSVFLKTYYTIFKALLHDVLYQPSDAVAVWLDVDDEVIWAAAIIVLLAHVGRVYKLNM
jgi:hypothetical protein